VGSIKYFGSTLTKDCSSSKQVKTTLNLAKIILQGTVEDKHRKGRPMNSWLDNIKYWTKQPTARLLRLVGNRQRWRIMVANASTVSP